MFAPIAFVVGAILSACVTYWSMSVPVATHVTEVTEVESSNVSNHTQDPGYLSSGYKYGNKFQCNRSLLRYVVTDEEHRQGALHAASLAQIVDTFQKCGVVALEGAIGRQDASDFRATLEQVGVAKHQHFVLYQGPRFSQPCLQLLIFRLLCTETTTVLGVTKQSSRQISRHNAKTWLVTSSCCFDQR